MGELQRFSDSLLALLFAKGEPVGEVFSQTKWRTDARHFVLPLFKFRQHPSHRYKRLSLLIGHLEMFFLY